MDNKKNNKGWFQIGNDGTCKKWATPEDLQIDIDKYFEECLNNTIEKLDSIGKKVTIKKPIPFTIEGLCDTLDCDRATLLNYQKAVGYEPYFNTIKRAKNKIQRNKLERGLTGDSNSAVTIFDLKNNHDYKDKTEQTIEIDKPEKITFDD
jgi:hypothetical protein